MAGGLREGRMGLKWIFEHFLRVGIEATVNLWLRCTVRVDILWKGKRGLHWVHRLTIRTFATLLASVYLVGSTNYERNRDACVPNVKDPLYNCYDRPSLSPQDLSKEVRRTRVECSTLSSRDRSVASETWHYLFAHRDDEFHSLRPSTFALTTASSKTSVRTVNGKLKSRAARAIAL